MFVSPRPSMLLALGLALLACSKDGRPARGNPLPEGAPTSVTVLPIGPRVEAGFGTVQLGIEARYANGAIEHLASSPELAWTSEPDTVVAVDPGGQAVGLEYGEALVTATYKGVQGVQTLRVNPGVLALRLFPLFAELQVGGELPLSVLALYQDGTELDVTTDPAASLAVDEAELAIVSAGAAIGLSEGVTALRATYHGHAASADLTIVPAATPPALASLLVEGPERLAQGTRGEATASAFYEDGTDEDVTGTVEWTSSEEGVLAVDGGALTPVAAGRSVLTARLVDGSTVLGEDTLEIEVLGSDVVLQSIALVPDWPGLAVLPLDVSTSFRAIGTFTGGYTQDVTQDAAWSVRNASEDDPGEHAWAGEAPGSVTTTVPWEVILLPGDVVVRAELPDPADPARTVAGAYPLTISGELGGLTVVSDPAPPFLVGSTPQFNVFGEYRDGDTPLDFAFDLTDRAVWFDWGTWSHGPVLVAVDSSAGRKGLGYALAPGMTSVGATYTHSHRLAVGWGVTAITQFLEVEVSSGGPPSPPPEL